MIFHKPGYEITPESGLIKIRKRLQVQWPETWHINTLQACMTLFRMAGSTELKNTSMYVEQFKTNMNPCVTAVLYWCYVNNSRSLMIAFLFKWTCQMCTEKAAHSAQYQMLVCRILLWREIHWRFSPAEATSSRKCYCLRKH